MPKIEYQPRGPHIEISNLDELEEALRMPELTDIICTQTIVIDRPTVLDGSGKVIWAQFDDPPFRNLVGDSMKMDFCTWIGNL